MRVPSMAKTASALALFGTACFVSAEPATYVIDPGHTVATFEALHQGTSTQRGRVTAREGSVTLDRAARTGKADVLLDAASVSVASSALEGVLKSARAFNVAQFPVIRFVGTSFAFQGDKVVAVDGMLTVLDRTQPVSLKATRFNCYENGQLKREVCGGDFETTVQRSQLGLGFSPGGAADDVHVLLQIEGIRQP
jgi:polyisoprenoid-binding protein YceI